MSVNVAKLGRLGVWVYSGARGRSGPLCPVVKDDGPGIPDPLREHSFAPFFTTKGGTQGTGLGLPTVKAIAEDAGGRVGFHTGPGGTTFEVVLPSVTPSGERSG